jgi:hypothetical protein
MVKMFDIIKFCNTNGDSCNNHYSKNKTAGNDPYISRRMRYSQMVRGNKYTTVRNFQNAIAPVVEELPAHLFPKGQIFGLGNRP